LARVSERKPIRVLDLASGGGDVPIALAERASRARLDVQIEGSDVSSEAMRFARSRALDRGSAIRFRTLDVLNDPLPEGYDVVTCSLFLHHLDEAAAIAVLTKMANAAGRLVLVNDLVRSRVGYVLAWTGCHLLSRSPIVRHDGPVSVAGAYTILEAGKLAERAGLVGASVSGHWPCRFLLHWSRGSP
jgi:2-polyprenyl-3-methyl-5-hydroxy-6-metoxy-1,4-benzoquinol methylase